MIIFFALLALSVSWGASNRLRGWGGGTTKTGQWIARHVLNRYTMAAWHGITVILAVTALGVPLWWQSTALAVSTAFFWWFAVRHGWGEYQDGQRAPNDEIRWIDATVQWLFADMFDLRWMTVKNVDGLSMALRGVYYLPVYIAAGLVMESWWFVLPVVFFWQAGAIYRALYGCKGDYVLIAEWVDDTIRGALFFTAFAGSVGLVG